MHPIWETHRFEQEYFGIEGQTFFVFVFPAFFMILFLLYRIMMVATHRRDIDVLKNDLEDERIDSAALYARLQSEISDKDFVQFCKDNLCVYEPPERADGE